jgi:uncharacterized cupredoxin-like copper-binding protein
VTISEMRAGVAAVLVVCSLVLVGSSAASTAPRLLTLSIRGDGGVYLNTVQLVGCSGSCRANYRSTTGSLVLTARPDSGWKFSYWNGGCVGTRPTCTLHVGAATHLAAVFTAIPPPPPPLPTVPPASVVTVTAAQPSEFSYLLSSQTVAEGVVTFQIKNTGALPHDFEVCAVPSDGTATSCAGSDTSMIPPGSSGTLTVTFTAPGTYEYLCTVPGHAAAGMRGLITVT